MSALPTISTTPDLLALATTANREHALAVQANRAAIEHAILAGEALLEARDHVPGGWVRWLEEHFDGGVSTAHQLIRFAMYKDEIPDGVGWSKANELLRGRPGTGNRPYWRHDPKVQERAVRLYRRGNKTLADVAGEVGVVQSTVHSWVRRAERLEQDRAAAAVIAQRERSRVIHKIGGSIAEGYSLIRKTAQMLDRAAEEATDSEVRAAINTALARLHAAEDEIVRALGVS